MIVKNQSRGTVIGDKVAEASTAATRRKGLLGRDGLAPGEGLWIVPCESVHTFFMRFPIDLIYMSRDLKVKKVRHAVGPWRLSACLTAHSLIELPAGTLKRTDTRKGDRIVFEK
jgi:uncharacterized protein